MSLQGVVNSLNKQIGKIVLGTQTALDNLRSEINNDDTPSIINDMVPPMITNQLNSNLPSAINTQIQSHNFPTFEVDYNLGPFKPVKRVILPNSSYYIVNDVALTPQSVTASSYSAPWVPTNATVFDNGGGWWLSGVDTHNPEWICYQYATPVIISGVYAYYGNGRNGANNKI